MEKPYIAVCVSLVFLITNMSFCISTSNISLATNIEYKKFCVYLAIPGNKNGPNLDFVKTLLEKQLSTIAYTVFGNISKAERDHKTENCTIHYNSSPECVFYRITKISHYLLEDLRNLQHELGSGNDDASDMYTILLSTWYLDRAFLNINCGPVNVKTLLPVVQWKYIAKWSNLVHSRQKFCAYAKPLGKSVARYLRREVKSICFVNQEPICQLIPMFDLVDSMANMCNLVPERNWETFGSTNYEYFKNAAYLSFYSMRHKAPTNISSQFNVNTQRATIQQGILSIFFKLYDNFRDDDLSLAKELLQVIPKGVYIPCDYTAQFPTFEWLLCACSKSFDQLRVYIDNHQKNGSLQYHKFLISNIDYREYIKNLKVSQIRELNEKNAVSLQTVATELKNNIQNRFQQLGKYFQKVAEFETAKLNADVDYLNGRIQMYTQRYGKYASQLSNKMKDLFGFFIGTATSDLASAVAKMAIRMAMAGNPLKWLTGGGNMDDIMESASEIAEASLLLTKAISSAVNFNKLVDFSKDLSRNLLKNKEMIQIVGKILQNVKSVSSVTRTEFGQYQSDFLEKYRDYSPQVSKDDLAKLSSYWDLFIEQVCSGIESTNSVIAIEIRGIGGTSGRCLEAKNQAVQLVACLEEIYDFQFELMEQMASLMHSYTQIESSKIIGSGPKAPNPNNLTVDALKTLIAVSSISYRIIQTTNVEMLCNIMEYQSGRMPSVCNGLSTDIDKLLSIKDPICSSKLQFISVSSKAASNDSNDQSWIDLSKVYNGETIQFKVPNSRWLREHLKLMPSENMDTFYVAGIEVYLPVVSPEGRPIQVTVTPTNINNKLHEDSQTTYSITPISPMKMTYSEGVGVACRLPTITNPYSQCGPKQRSTIPKICPFSLGTSTWQGNGRLFPSIYSKFDIRVEGYETEKLDVPVTNVPIMLGIKYCSVNPILSGSNRKGSNIFSALSSDITDSCCPQEKQYYNEDAKHCQACPPGTKSFFDGLFCGDVIKIVVATNMTSNFTYSAAVTACRDAGSVIASTAVLAEARRLGSKSCYCGWFEGSYIDSISNRTECHANNPCSTSQDVKFAYCSKKYSPVKH